MQPQTSPKPKAQKRVGVLFVFDRTFGKQEFSPPEMKNLPRTPPVHFPGNHRSAWGLVHICPITISKNFVRFFCDITGPRLLRVERGIHASNQFQITTAVFSEHRCRIGFYGSKVTCASAAGPSDFRRRRADSSRHSSATTSLHWFLRIKVHLGVPKDARRSLQG